MKRLATIILTSTILLTGCSSNDKIAMLENAVKSSKDLIAKEEFEQAKGLLVYVSQNGGSKIDGYSNLNGQLDKLLLATEYYENEKYEESIKLLKELFNKEDTEGGIIKGVVALGSKIKEKTENNTIQVDNKVTSNLITWDNVYASSHLIQKSMNYKVENVIDDNPSTAWIEGVSDDGIGQFIQFSSNNTFRVDKIDIINGFSKNQKTYMKNNRVKKVIIEFSDKSQQVYELEDNNMEYQTIDIGGINTNSVKVIIQEVYTNGRVYKDTCISEISVYGQEL
ncbi:MAG: discoidin domain-containing protein [Romboutsia timonensis]|uniref:discoidin domain-containing protein n=1 Tax=Romboutsia timonensis TaxID=1776391 RepID=UPI002A7572EC|nr:discoidin domain-containing protein [Romboutsia timonensis]MDY3000442.1 discoidin domain-containing protein [Romboutsia timonensis]